MKNADKQPFADGDPNDHRIEIGAQMIKGAIIGSVVVFGPIVFIYLVYLLGTILPPESKEAEDPTPDSFSWINLAPQSNQEIAFAFTDGDHSTVTFSTAS